MCPGWWAGRGCLLLLLLLLAPAAPTTTPGAPGAPPYRLKPRPQHQQHSSGGAPWVPRERRPLPPSDLVSASAAPPPTPASQVVPPLVPGPGSTASDPSLMVRNTRSTPTNITRNFRHHHKYRQQLYSENSGRVMKLLTDGTVHFTDNLTDPHTLLYVRPIQRGVMEMRSEATGLFLCMNKRGKLYASCNRSSECEFVSRLEDTYYDTLQSRRFSGRYLAIATSGRIKRARRVSGPLGKENFFLFRRTQLQEAQRIIERYHERLVGQPPQRCDGYNEYNMTTAGSTSEKGQGGGGATVVTLAPTVVPMGHTPTTTTTKPSPSPASRRCRIVNGKKRCKWCRIVKGKRKCRKRPKRCKNKKCRKRKKQRKNKRRRKQGRERDSHEVNTTITVDREIPHRRKMVMSAGVRKAQPRQRHRGGGRQPQHTRYTSDTVGSQARRPRHHRRLPTAPPMPVATPSPSRVALRMPSGPPWPVPMTVTPQPQRPFPLAPSSARPYRVRHAHDARRRRRRPRGHPNPPTSADA